MSFLLGLFLIGGAILPSLAWLFFFLKEDVHPEPKRLIILTFSAGALSTIPTLLIQLVLPKTYLSAIWGGILLVIALALTEEFFKFLSAYWAVRRDPAFDEPIDAMIYPITAALGFAAVENIFIASDAFNPAVFDSFGETMSVLLLRFVGATLLHVLASGLLGFYWARRKILIGLLVATLVHAIFNYIILQVGESSLFYGSLFLIVAAFFLFQDFEKLKAA